MEVSNVDIVQGWRSPVGRDKGPRYYYSRGLNAMLNAAFGMSLKDNKSGFILCAREVMEDLLSYRGSYYYWQSFIMVAAHAQGLHVQADRDALREPPRRQVVPRQRAGQGGRAQLRRHRQGARRVSAAAAIAVDAAHVPRSRAAAGARRAGADVAPRCTGTATCQLFGATHWMMTKEVGTQLEDLRESQWLSPDKMRELQLDKLRKLVRHAYRTCRSTATACASWASCPTTSARSTICRSCRS